MHRKHRLLIWTRCTPAIPLVSALSVHAHGFGQRYDLPVPLWLYLTGAGITVAVSFLMMVLFVRESSQQNTYPRVHLLRSPIGRALSHPVMLWFCRGLALALFLLIVLAGFFGHQNPFKNITPIMVWAIWWVGMTYVSALVGNLWALINPFDAAFAIAEGIYGRIRHNGSLSLYLPYPNHLDVWPAVVLFFAFAWAELVWEDKDVPANIAAMLLSYGAITWAGMYLFGRKTWLDRGEAFSLVFGLFARFSPMESRLADSKWEWNLRPYAVGLLTDKPMSPSLMVLVVLVLATVTFDGFIETPLWARFAAWLMPPSLDSASELAASEYSGVLLYSLALLGFLIVFLLVYGAFAWLIARAASAKNPKEQSVSAQIVARHCVLTLIPIAIAYHLAHYLSFLLMAGEYVIPLVSDPFGIGWDLFGTTRYFVGISIVDARFVWYTSVVAIIIGHVIAVYLAHVMAWRIFRDKQAALRSQYPMLTLMVCYTMLSLWIIAQPIVSSQRAASRSNATSERTLAAQECRYPPPACTSPLDV